MTSFIDLRDDCNTKKRTHIRTRLFRVVKIVKRIVKCITLIHLSWLLYSVHLQVQYVLKSTFLSHIFQFSLVVELLDGWFSLLNSRSR